MNYLQRPVAKAEKPPADWRTYVLVWVVDPVTKHRHLVAKTLLEVQPTDERFKLK